MTEQYIIIIRYNGKLESEWENINDAKNKAKELHDVGVYCDVYSKVIDNEEKTR